MVWYFLHQTQNSAAGLVLYAVYSGKILGRETNKKKEKEPTRKKWNCLERSGWQLVYHVLIFFWSQSTSRPVLWTPLFLLPDIWYKYYCYVCISFLWKLATWASISAERMLSCVTSDNIISQDIHNSCFANKFWHVRHKPDSYKCVRVTNQPYK